MGPGLGHEMALQIDSILIMRHGCSSRKVPQRAEGESNTQTTADDNGSTRTHCHDAGVGFSVL